MKRTKRVLGLALAAVMCMGLLAGCGAAGTGAGAYPAGALGRTGQIGRAHV